MIPVKITYTLTRIVGGRNLPEKHEEILDGIKQAEARAREVLALPNSLGSVQFWGENEHGELTEPAGSME